MGRVLEKKPFTSSDELLVRYLKDPIVLKAIELMAKEPDEASHKQQRQKQLLALIFGECDGTKISKR